MNPDKTWPRIEANCMLAPPRCPEVWTRERPDDRGSILYLPLIYRYSAGTNNPLLDVNKPMHTIQFRKNGDALA